MPASSAGMTCGRGSIRLCYLAECDAVYMRAEMEEGYALQQADHTPLSVAMEEMMADNDDDDGGQDDIHHKLAALFDQARDRQEAVGNDNFFG